MSVLKFLLPVGQNQTQWLNDKTIIIEPGYCKISSFVSVLQIISALASNNDKSKFAINIVIVNCL